MVSSCSVCAIICFRAADSLWTQKFFKPSSISNKETKWAFLLWNGCAVKGDITCLVWTASRTSVLFSAAPDAPWRSSSVGTYRPETHILMGTASLATFSCPFEVCYLWQVLCEVHQPVCAPLTQQFLLRLPALYDRQAFLNLKVWPGDVTRVISVAEYQTFVSLTLSICLSRSRRCLSSTFLCTSTRLRIVLSLSTSDIPCPSVTLDCLSVGLHLTFQTENSRVLTGVISAGCTNTPSPDLLWPVRYIWGLWCE